MIFEKLKLLISEQFDIDEDAITLDTSFEDDLHADSLDLADMLCILKSEFDVQIENERLAHLKTVGDVVELLENYQG